MKGLLKSTVFATPLLALAATAMGADPAVVTDAAAAAAANSTAIPALWYIAPVSSIIALIFAVVFYKKMMSAPEGNPTMIEIAQHVREGAYAYLFKQYKVVTMVFALLLVI